MKTFKELLRDCFVQAGACVIIMIPMYIIYWLFCWYIVDRDKGWLPWNWFKKTEKKTEDDDLEMWDGDQD